LAVEGRLGSDVRRVEGRARGESRVGDYALILRDGTEVSADLYSPRSRGTPEDMARHVETKSGQADIAVVELPGGAGPKTLELAHRIADALIANANTNLKRILVLADNKMVLDRALAKSGRETLRVKERVQQARAGDPGRGSSREEMGRPQERLPFEASRLHGVSEALGRQEARASAFEGAAQMIHSFQFHSLQDAEIEKIYRRLQELSPRIETLRSSGYTVEVWGKAQMPDQVDIAAGITDTQDQSQVVKFVDLWLVPRRVLVEAKPNPYPTMRGDPSVPSGGDPGRSYEQFPDKGWHFVTGLAFTFEPYPQANP